MLVSVVGLPGQGKPAPSGSSPRGDTAGIARQAEAALSQGKYESAVRDFEQLVKMEPASAEFNLKLGTAYYFDGRPRDAVPPLQQALKAKPGLAQARYVLGVSLAESAHCREALPYLNEAAGRASDRTLKRPIYSDGVKCAMELNQQDNALSFLQHFRREFPHDPAVLYLSVHVYSDLSTRASQELLVTAPRSNEVHELNAEVLEMQGKWDEAAEEYRKVLALDPHVPGIHYRLGRLILSKPKTATMVADARQEFEEELKIDPGNAGAEYVLGELARQSEDWDAAIEHFSRAVKDDPNFGDATMELGRTLLAAGRAAEAVAPLEQAVKLQPDNPTAHYQLSLAYRHAGREEDAKKEMAAYQQTSTKARENLQGIRSAVTGRETPAQTGAPLPTGP